MIRTNTAIQVESVNGIREISLETSLFENRKIFLSGEINMEMANDFIRQMMYLDDDSGQEINIYINSPGGEVLAGLLIYDIIQSAECPINVYCTGMAYSMAAVLLASAEQGRRFILPHSKVMIHEPLISQGLGGNATSIKNISDSIMETKKLIVKLLSKHIEKSEEELEEAIRFDNYMTADKAVEFGLCDKIIIRL